MSTQLLLGVRLREHAHFDTYRAGDSEGNALALAAVPALGVLLARRLDLLRTRAFWTPAVLVVLLCGPWYALTTGYQASSWDGGASPHWGYTRAATPIYLGGLVQDLGGVGVAVLALAGLLLAAVLNTPLAWSAASDLLKDAGETGRSPELKAGR